MSCHLSRRAILSSGLAAAAVAARPGNGGAQEKRQNRKLRVGVFGLDYTFWGLWADLLSPNGRWAGTSLFNMEMAYVWDKDAGKARAFADQWGCGVVDRYDGMLGKVDGVVNGGLYNVPWQHLLFRPYIEAGVPTYLSRPWSSTLRDLDGMLELAAEHDTPLIASATHEHYNEADNFNTKLRNLAPVESAYATCHAGDRPHFHVPYMMLKILGYNVDSVSLVTDDPREPSYLQTTYIYGKSDGQPPFALAMHASQSYIYSFSIIGTNGTEHAYMPGETSFFNRFAPQLIDIQKTLEGATYQPFDNVRRKFELVQAEYYSHYERGGQPVKVGTVPPDWPIPAWRPDWYTAADFK